MAQTNEGIAVVNVNGIPFERCEHLLGNIISTEVVLPFGLGTQGYATGLLGH